MDKNIKDLIKISLVYKVSILLIVLLVVQLLPFCEGCRLGNFLYPRGESFSLASAYKTWDSQYFIYVAENGYKPGMINNVAHPLFPFLMREFSRFFKGNIFVSGLLLSNIFSLVAVVIMYKWLETVYTKRQAFVSSLFLLMFPTAFYLNLIYAESLFLLLVVTLFYSLYKRNYKWLLISSFLLPLARAQGLLLVVPILVYGWIKNRRVIVYGVGGMLIGWLVYLMIMKYFTGSYWSGYLGHSMNVSQFSVENIFKPWQWFKSNFIDIKLSLHGFNTSIINRLFFAGALAIMALGYKRLDKPMWSYLAVGFIVPAMLGQFMSYPRLIVAVVPMYICLVKVFKNLKYLYLIPALILQMLFLIMHVLNFWVA